MKRTRCDEPPLPAPSYPPEGFFRRALYLWSFSAVPFFGYSEAREHTQEPWTLRRVHPSRRRKRCGLRES